MREILCPLAGCDHCYSRPGGFHYISVCLSGAALYASFGQVQVSAVGETSLPFLLSLSVIELDCVRLF